MQMDKKRTVNIQSHFGYHGNKCISVYGKQYKLVVNHILKDKATPIKQ